MIKSCVWKVCNACGKFIDENTIYYRMNVEKAERNPHREKHIGKFVMCSECYDKSFGNGLYGEDYFRKVINERTGISEEERKTNGAGHQHFVRSLRKGYRS